MKQHALMAVMVLNGLYGTALAKPNVDAGLWTFLQNTTGNPLTPAITPGPPGETPGDETGGLDSNEQTISQMELAVEILGIGGTPQIEDLVIVEEPGLVFSGIGAGPDNHLFSYPNTIGYAYNSTAGGVEVLANGLLARAYISTVGASFGSYTLKMEISLYGLTTEVFGPTLQSETATGRGPLLSTLVVDGTITVIPEPASVVLGLFAAAGLGAVAIRRRRGRR